MNPQQIAELAGQAQSVGWLPGPVPLFHACVSAVLSQRVRFAASRALRARLYTSCQLEAGQFLTPNHLARVNHVEVGLTVAQCTLLMNICAAEERNTLFWEFPHFHGVGRWTIDAVAIMAYLDPDIFLFGDKYILTNLQQLTGLALTETDVVQWSLEWRGGRSCVARFLWRLRREAIPALRRGEALTMQHFYL